MPNIRESATEIVRRLQSAGFEAWWVGGCVRDLLLGREPQDYDIATSALPADIEALFSRTIPVGRQFGVLLVQEKGLQFQVATFRAEGDYQDGRHPGHVSFGDAKADACRRDFTINGLFLDPILGELHDWVGGEKDLRSRTLRTIGNAEERFAEDHLRLLRAVRLAAQLDFQIEPSTLLAVRVNAPKIKSVSAERVRDELIKLFRPPYAARGLELLNESGLLDEILPELAATRTCEQSPDYHPEGTVFNHIRLMLAGLPPAAHESLPWAALLHDIAKPVTASRDPVTGSIHFYGHERIGDDMSRTVLERLRFPRKQIEEIATCVRHHMQIKDAPQMRKSTLRRLLMRPTFSLELDLHRLDCLASHGRMDVYDFLVSQSRELEREPAPLKPLLTGDDLISLGINPGRELGALLDEIREKQLLDEITTPEQALAWARQKIKK